jgi:hypothetical protein
MQSGALDPRLKKLFKTNSNEQEAEHQHHYTRGKRRIGREIDQQAATTSSKELDARLQAS